jgi:hypothetical protein
MNSRETKQMERALRAADGSSIVAIVFACLGAVAGAFSSGPVRIAAWCTAGIALVATFVRQNGAAQREEARLRALPFKFPVDAYLAILGSSKTRHVVTLRVSLEGRAKAAAAAEKQLGTMRGTTRVTKDELVLESPVFDTRRTPMNDETPEVDHETAEVHKWTREVLSILVPLHERLPIDGVAVKSSER